LCAEQPAVPRHIETGITGEPGTTARLIASIGARRHVV
jgi:hypothetical protein